MLGLYILFPNRLANLPCLLFPLENCQGWGVCRVQVLLTKRNPIFFINYTKTFLRKLLELYLPGVTRTSTRIQAAPYFTLIQQHLPWPHWLVKPLYVSHVFPLPFPMKWVYCPAWAATRLSLAHPHPSLNSKLTASNSCHSGIYSPCSQVITKLTTYCSLSYRMYKTENRSVLSLR